MTLSKEDAEGLDKILNFAINEAKVKDPEQWHLVIRDLSTDITRALGLDIPDSKTRHYAELLNDSTIVKMGKYLSYQLSEKTVQFIEDGGFTKSYDEVHYNQVQEQSDLELDRKVKQLTIRLGEVELKQRKERILLLIVAAIISAAITTVFNLFF